MILEKLKMLPLKFCRLITWPDCRAYDTEILFKIKLSARYLIFWFKLSVKMIISEIIDTV